MNIDNEDGLDLLIFPGGGSPENSLYREVYELLRREANKAGYQEISVLTWPGHSDKLGMFNSELTMEGAKQVAEKKIIEQEKKGKQYHILGRSFGTIVALSCALTTATSGLSKLILWGPPPHWLIWELFKKNFNENKTNNASKGLNISEHFIDGVIPIEYLLKNANLRSIITTGSEDPYSPPEFWQYLKSIYGLKENLFFRDPVKGCKHEVTEDTPNWKAYIHTLFYE